MVLLSQKISNWILQKTSHKKQLQKHNGIVPNKFSFIKFLSTKSRAPLPGKSALKNCNIPNFNFSFEEIKEVYWGGDRHSPILEFEFWRSFWLEELGWKGKIAAHWQMGARRERKKKCALNQPTRHFLQHRYQQILTFGVSANWARRLINYRRSYSTKEDSNKWLLKQERGNDPSMY